VKEFDLPEKKSPKEKCWKINQKINHNPIHRKVFHLKNALPENSSPENSPAEYSLPEIFLLTKFST
jgi:hypothetical protein